MIGICSRIGTVISSKCGNFFCQQSSIRKRYLRRLWCDSMVNASTRSEPRASTAMAAINTKCNYPPLRPITTFLENRFFAHSQWPRARELDRSRPSCLYPRQCELDFGTMRSAQRFASVIRDSRSARGRGRFACFKIKYENVFRKTRPHARSSPFGSTTMAPPSKRADPVFPQDCCRRQWCRSPQRTCLSPGAYAQFSSEIWGFVNTQSRFHAIVGHVALFN